MGIPDKGNPRETVLAGEVSKGSDGAEALPGRIDRYSTARHHAVGMIAHLQAGTKALPESEARRVMAALAACGNYLLFRHYYTVNKVRLSGAHTCKQHHICPLCAIRRGAKMLKAYLDRYTVIQGEKPGLRASLCTLTVKNGPDLPERFAHLQKGVRTLLERRRACRKGNRGSTEFRKVEGLVGTYEVTQKGKGWHPHTHMVILHREELDKELLSQEWKRITGDSHVIDIRPLEHPEAPAVDFVEVFKYAIKFSDLTFEDNLRAYWDLKGKRMVFSAGCFWGVKVPEELTDELIDGIPYIELFYRYSRVKGYTIERVTNMHMVDIEVVEKSSGWIQEHSVPVDSKLAKTGRSPELAEYVLKYVASKFGIGFEFFQYAEGGQHA